MAVTSIEIGEVDLAVQRMIDDIGFAKGAVGLVSAALKAAEQDGASIRKFDIATVLLDRVVDRLNATSRALHDRMR